MDTTRNVFVMETLDCTPDSYQHQLQHWHIIPVARLESASTQVLLLHKRNVHYHLVHAVIRNNVSSIKNQNQKHIKRNTTHTTIMTFWLHIEGSQSI